MKKNALIIMLSCNILFLGCASKAIEIKPAYTSPNTYSSWECNQISNELLRINNKVSELTGEQDKLYKNDQAMGWLGSFFLWPLYLFIKGDGPIAAELAKFKGQKDALEQISNQKNCGG